MGKRKYKVGITSFAAHGGSGVVATELGLALVDRGHEVHFITNALPIRLKRFQEDVFFHEVQAVHYPAFPHTPYMLALASKMTEVVQYHELDLLHVHYAIPHAAAGFLAQKMLEPYGVKLVTTLHGTDITLVGQEPGFWPMTQFLINQSDAVTAVSKFLEEETRKTFEIKRKIEVIHNFVDTKAFRPRPDLRKQNPLAPRGEKIVVHASNLRPVKNLPTVIRVFEEIQKEVDARLVIVGDGPERASSERLARELGIEGKVVFLGVCESMEELLAMSDVLLLPSEHESFGLVALEAMSAGTPVVASDRGGLPELIVDGSSGFLHDPHDLKGQAASVLALLKDPALARRIGEEARERARESFCIECVVDDYVEVYQGLMEAGGSGG